MIDLDAVFEKECEEYLLYLYELAARKYADHPDPDTLIQDCMMALIVKRNRGETVEYPKGFLAAVMKNKYNEYLRQKYKNEILLFGYDGFSELENGDCENEENERLDAEYALVRREIGRLIGIYREVTVLHYVHGYSVERIARDLGVSSGTVKSRLSNARGQIKEGLKKMEKYASISYAPKRLTLGIWGNDSMIGEPFSLLQSPIEANILILAYEKPISARAIADTMGMPGAYLEPLIEKLIKGELLGRTDGGLLYTRCFLQRYEDSFGNIKAQEMLADQYAEQVWRIVWKHIEPLTAREAFTQMSEKQKATMLLFVLNKALAETVFKCKPVAQNEPQNPPVRPNGGRWLATGTIFEHGQVENIKYDSSGPVQVAYSKNDDGTYDCKMFDLQSLFGDAHWAYGTFKYKCSLRSILRFYASFLPCDVKTDNRYLTELIPEFEKLCILKRDEDGEVRLDVPALTFEEAATYWKPVFKNIKDELLELLCNDIANLWVKNANRVPKHVDEREYFLHAGALGAYPRAQMLAIVEKGLLPYAVNVGKTPIIYMEYRKK
ncbi:MAG: sigma-70 family RNA polymerase sigma factor [Clostridia bacterium]|nr:sigma-70 family RNA polymerase sigma factor [Clostridia bacterium]